MVAKLKKGKFDKEITSDEVKQFLANEIAGMLKEFEKKIEISDNPFVILLAGVNGSGKTTAIGKLAHRFKAMGKSVGIIAADTFRAAAIGQLKVWADRTNSAFYAKEEGSDAASVVYEGLAKAKEDVILIDTAGRLQNKKELLFELEKIVRTIKKLNPDAPHITLLTLDATVGQNAISQLEVFDETVNVSGLIINKLDGSSKAGVLLALAEQFKKPVYLVGMGEGIDDLKDFSSSDYAENLMLK